MHRQTFQVQRNCFLDIRFRFFKALSLCMAASQRRNKRNEPARWVFLVKDGKRTTLANSLLHAHYCKGWTRVTKSSWYSALSLTETRLLHSPPTPPPAPVTAQEKPVASCVIRHPPKSRLRSRNRCRHRRRPSQFRRFQERRRIPFPRRHSGVYLKTGVRG